MAIIIYTYSNPYKINREQYWALVKNSFHLCVSQTLVNGLCDQYREFYKGKLTTIDRFINKLFLDWESDAVEISQRAYIDNVIDYMSFREYVDDDLSEEDIKLSLKRNRSYVLDCQHFFRQIFLGYFSDIVQAFDTLRKNVCGDDYTSLHNPIVLSSVLPAYGMFHSIQILFL